MRCTVLVLAGIVALFVVDVTKGAEHSKLTVRVSDADTGDVLPARLAIKAFDGSYPGDRLRLSSKQWPNIEGHAVFIAGEETIELPAGTTSIVAAHGAQYSTDTKSIELKAGKS